MTAARVLVVDDVEANRDLLARRLRRMGHTVETADDGAQALDRMKDGAWDLVMLDVMMPVLGGIDTLTALKAADATRHVPVIMISANTELESVVRCIELGADDYLPKPFEPVLLRARVGASLEKKWLRDREQERSRRMQHDLEIGARIQRDFLPDALPAVAGYEFAAFFEPAREVGGDFYDAFPIDGGQVAFALGDVCDKGVGAALFMALFRTLLRAGLQATSPSDVACDRVGRVLQHTNDYIAETHGRTNMFATLFVALLDPATGTVTYVNGGHEPPRVIGPDGATRVTLGATGPAVGMLAGIPYGTASVTLGAGETLFVPTDGVAESRSVDGTLLGDPALEALLREPAPSAAALLDRVAAAVAHHASGRSPADDVTMLGVRRA